MEQVKTWMWDAAYASLGGVYISVMVFLDRIVNHFSTYKHEDIDFWYGKATAAIVFLLVVTYHIKRIFQLNKKHKHEVSTQSYFDGYIIAGNELRNVKQYDLALSKFQKALELNFDNDIANAKINEVKYLLDATHK